MRSPSSVRSAGPTPGRPATDGRVYGSQRPRIHVAPPVRLSSAGQEAVDLARKAGLELDDWQQWVLDQGLAEKPDGTWAAEEVCVNLPRQNGKGGVIEARVLWGIYIGDERVILVSAHEFKTAMNTMKRIERLINNCPDLHKRLKAVHRSAGREAIELHGGQEIRFIARSKGSGRGFTADCIILDECMVLGDEAMGALAPTTDAVENSQLWYLGSAGIGAPSVQMARLRRRALEALESGVPDPTLCYMEWSIDPHRDECPTGCTEHDDVDSVESLLKANPAVGYRLPVERTLHRLLTMGAFLYSRERLGVGDYPSDRADMWKVIGEDAWRSLADAGAEVEDGPVFSIDMTPERSHTAIGVAGPYRGGTHVEVVEHQPGVGWVLERAEQLHKDHRPRAWVIDPQSPAATLIPKLQERLGIEVLQPKYRDTAAACGEFYDAVADQSLSHIDQAPLATALAGAQKRPLAGDGWAWARRNPGVDISPLMAVTLARWGMGAAPVEEYDPLDNVF